MNLHAHPMMGRVARSLVFALLIASTGCGQSGERQARGVADDALLVAQVRAKIAQVDAATVGLVHVANDAGAVTLTGKIATMKERIAMDAAARAVDGVKSVDDRVVVDASAPTAAQLEADLALSARVRGALVEQTGVNAARIHVDVHRGVVTLTGELPSAAHRTVADQTVRGVSGVVAVVDDLTVTAPASRRLKQR